MIQNTSSIQSLLRSHLASLPPYTPIEPFEVLSARLGRSPEEIIKLDANENPYGPSPQVRQALAKLSYPHIYPDPESRALRAALSSFNGVPVENLMASAGADELIDIILRLFIEPGEFVLNCPPTFGMYTFDTSVNSGKVINILRKPDFSLDLPAVRQAVETFRPKILFLATPNNPDGSIVSSEVIEEILEMPLLVVLDEAYIEFCDHGKLGEFATRISLVKQRENLIVLRTFSKWAGLAGLRVGYGAFPGWLMPFIWKSKQPYHVNVAASAAAIAALEDLPYLVDLVSRIRMERLRLMDRLQEVPYLRPYPSQANFILCQVLGKDAAQIKSDLATQYGIFLRYFNTPGLQDHIRISIGRPQDTDALIRALKDF
jgi:histidinol-phosphate aminotransferase